MMVTRSEKGTFSRWGHHTSCRLMSASFPWSKRCMAWLWLWLTALRAAERNCAMNRPGLLFRWFGLYRSVQVKSSQEILYSRSCYKSDGKRQLGYWFFLGENQIKFCCETWNCTSTLSRVLTTFQPIHTCWLGYMVMMMTGHFVLCTPKNFIIIISSWRAYEPMQPWTFW